MERKNINRVFKQLIKSLQKKRKEGNWDEAKGQKEDGTGPSCICQILDELDKDD